MNRLKQCILAGLVSCFLAVPCLSLADDVTLAKGDGQGPLLCRPTGKVNSCRLSAPRIMRKPFRSSTARLQNIPMMPMLTTAAARFTASSDGTTKPWPIRDKAISLEPGTAFHYFNRGAIYEQRKEYPLAVNDYTKALALSQKGDPLQGLMYSTGPGPIRPSNRMTRPWMTSNRGKSWLRPFLRTISSKA